MTAAAMAGDLMALQQASKRVSEWAVEPLADLLVGRRRWIVLPDVDFSQVPISWLSYQGRFTFETLLVEGAPDLASLRTRRSIPLRRAVAFADPWSASDVSPLPEARREVEELVRLLPIVKTSFGRQATLSHLRDLAAQADLVHFAGHVQGGSSLAGSVRLLLAPDELLTDGRASLRDIAGLPLRDLQLAVLSACSSSYSKPARLAGSLGFAQAFLRAGAAESIGTLWAVDDRQQRLVMTALYQRLTRGMSASETLRNLWQSEIATGGADPDSLSASASLQLLTSIGREQESPQ
jgi:CHAT domain-containing protein